MKSGVQMARTTKAGTNLGQNRGQNLPGKFQKLARKLGFLAVGAACCVAVMAPSTGLAASSSITQLKFLQTLTQLTGDGHLFSAGSQASDYAQWAVDRGVDPTGGWKPASKLSSDVLAQSLVQLYGLNPRKYGGDYYRILEREGIIIERGATVSGEAFASLIDNPVVTLKSVEIAGDSTSPNKPGNGNGFGFGLGNNPNGIPVPEGNPPPNPGNPHRTGNPHVPR